MQFKTTIIAIGLLRITALFAEEIKFTPEQHEAVFHPFEGKMFKQIREKMKDVEYEVKSYDKAFCQEMLDDFINWENFQVVQPDFATNDYNDSKLQEALGECKKVQFNRLRLFDFSTDGSPDDVTNEEWDLMAYAIVYGHWGYRFYDIDFDNNASNGTEQLLYVGGYHGEYQNPELYAKDRVAKGWDHYYLMKVKPDCNNTANALDLVTLKGNVMAYETNIQPSLDVEKDNKLTGHINGVVKYKESYYIVTLTQFIAPKVSFKAYDDYGSRIQNTCYYYVSSK
jgi:hypothetical protein